MSARANDRSSRAWWAVVCGAGALLLAVVAGGLEYVDATTRRLFGQSLLVTTPLWAVPAVGAVLLAGCGVVAWLRFRPTSAAGRVGLALCIVVLVLLPLAITREKTTAGHLVALDPATGAALWDSALPMSVVSSSFADGDVIVASGFTRCGEESTVVGIDAATGDVRWQRQGDGFSEISGVAGGVAVVSNFDSRDLVAIDAQSGDELWSQPAVGLTGEAAMDPRVFHTASLVLESGPGGVVAIDRRTGDELWSTEAEPGRSTTVATGGQSTIALVAPGRGPGEPGNVRALDPDTGATSWEAEVAALTSSSPIATDDAVIVSSGEPDSPDRTGSQLVALSAADGQVLWQVPDPSPFDGSGPAVAAGVLARTDFGDETAVAPTLVGIDLATGATRWTTDLPPGSIWLSAGGDAAVMTGNSTVTVWDATTGDQRWSVASAVVAEHPSRAAMPIDGAVLLGDDGRSRSCSGIGS